MNDDIDRLAQLLLERFDRLEAKVDAGFAKLQGSLDAVGGHLAIGLDKLEQRLDRVVSDTGALTENFIPKEENERRLRSLERGQRSLELSRDELRGRLDQQEQTLYVVGERAHKAGNGSGE